MLNRKIILLAARNFSTNALIEGRGFKQSKIDKVEINMLTKDIFWTHEFNRVDNTNDKAEYYLCL